MSGWGIYSDGRWVRLLFTAREDDVCVPQLTTDPMKAHIFAERDQAESWARVLEDGLGRYFVSSQVRNPVLVPLREAS